MHKNYIYILHFYYKFRLRLTNDAFIEVDCNMDDEKMVNVAADIEEVRDVILTLIPHIHTALVKIECEGCTLYHPSQTQHRCLDPVDEETARIRIDQCLAKCTGELIRMVYVSNNRTMPTIQVSSVLEIHGQLIKGNFQLGNIGTVSTEDIIMNFMLNIDQLLCN